MSRIKIESEDFGNILISAVRYALPRNTYICSETIRFITPILPLISDRTIIVLQKDVEKALSEDKCSSYDKSDWIKFLKDISYQIETRLL